VFARATHATCSALLPIHVHCVAYQYVIMANHVHLLIQPKIAPDHLLKSLKGASAREANRMLGRTGEPFWQKESYDHWVRNQEEFEKIRRYIENNPAKAGLVRSPEDYPWSSAGVEKSLDAARTSAYATIQTTSEARKVWISSSE
jgi:REP element-mobilizing transposase RayT